MKVSRGLSISRRLIICACVAGSMSSWGQPPEGGDNDCVETGIFSPCAWVCETEGSISYAELDGATNFVVCVGSGISGLPSATASISSGSKKCDNGINTLVCTESPNYGTNPNQPSEDVAYILSEIRWEPEIPETFDTPGEFTFIGYVKGVSSDSVCDDTEEVEAGALVVLVIHGQITGPEEIKAMAQKDITTSESPPEVEWADWQESTPFYSIDSGVPLLQATLDFTFEHDIAIDATYSLQGVVCVADSFAVTVGPNGSISGAVLSPGGGHFFSQTSGAIATFRNTAGGVLGGGSIGLGQNGACVSCYRSLANIRSGPVQVIVEWFPPSGNYWRGAGWFEVEPGGETTGADVTLELVEF